MIPVKEDLYYSDAHKMTWDRGCAMKRFIIEADSKHFHELLRRDLDHEERQRVASLLSEKLAGLESGGNRTGS